MKTTMTTMCHRSVRHPRRRVRRVLWPPGLFARVGGGAQGEVRAPHLHATFIRSYADPLLVHRSFCAKNVAWFVCFFWPHLTQTLTSFCQRFWFARPVRAQRASSVTSSDAMGMSLGRAPPIPRAPIPRCHTRTHRSAPPAKTGTHQHRCDRTVLATPVYTRSVVPRQQPVARRVVANVDGKSVTDVSCPKCVSRVSLLLRDAAHPPRFCDPQPNIAARGDHNLALQRTASTCAG
jgi:hypothetical protein